MAATKKTAKAAETAAEVKAAAPAEEKKTTKKTAAKKTAAPKTAAKKTTTRKAAAKANVYVQYLGAQVTTEELIEKAKAASGVAAPKSVDVYVKPEENKVYYVVDEQSGSFFLV